MDTLISNNLRKIREERKLSKAKVARKIDTTRSNLTRWEQNTLPSVKYLIRLAELYSVSLDKLILGKSRDGDGNSPASTKKNPGKYHMLCVELEEEGFSCEERFSTTDDIGEALAENNSFIILKASFEK